VGAATTLTLEGSSTFTAVAGALMAGAPAFLVTDGGGNGVPNVPLQVSVSDGQGGTSSASINTDANGRFALSSIAAKPTAGTYTFTITNAGLAGSPITVQGNVVNAAAHHVKFLTGPVTAQPAGTAMSIVIEVQDQFNNRTTTGPGATANVTLALSGGTVGAVLGPDAAARTQAAVSGVATFSVNVNLAGTGYVVFASAPELSLPAVASGPFDVSAGAPAVVSSVLGEGAGLIQGDEQVLRALVKDASGNNLVGASVTFTVISGGGTLNSSTAPQTTSTGTDGTASADFRPGTAGIQLVRATAGSASVDFHLFLAETLAVVIEPTQNPQSGLPLTTQPRVALRDLQGNPVRRAGIDLLAEVITDPPLQDVLRPTLSGNVVARTDANGEATWTNLAVVGQIQTVRLAISEAGEFPTIRPVLSQLLGLQAGAGIAVRSLNTSPAFRNVGADVDFTYRTTDGFNAVPNVAVLVSSVSANCPLVSGASQDTVVSDASGSVTVRVHAPDGPASCNIYAILRDLPTLCAPPACDPTQWFVVDRLLIVPNGMWVWVGGQLTSSDWSDTRNWYLDGRNNGTIPSATETAFIPGFFAPVTNTLPVVSGSVDVGSLITEIGGGFVVDAGNTLRINGNVDIQGSVSGTGTVWLSPNGDVRNGTLRAFTLQGTLRIGPTDRTCTETSPYTMVGPVVVGQLDLRCRLEMAKETMSVTGDALVTDGGWLLMSQAGAFLSIQGNATFDGNATLTDGFMQVGKNFSHTGNGDSRAFSASGNHRTQIVGDATGGLAFQWNTPGGFSRFGTLDFLTTKGVVAIKSDQAATLTADQFHVGAASQVAIPANVILGIPALPLGNALTIDKDGILTLEDLRSVAGLACAALKVGDNVGPLSCLVGK